MSTTRRNTKPKNPALRSAPSPSLLLVGALFLLTLAGGIYYVTYGQAAATPKVISNRPPSGAPAYFPGQAFVNFKVGTSETVITTTLAARNARIIETMPETGSKLIAFSGDTLATIATLNADPSVEYASPNHIYYSTATNPNDSFYNKNYTTTYYNDYGRKFTKNYRNREQWGLRLINAPGAWDITKGTDTMIAVIDTGIDHEHPDLRGKVKRSVVHYSTNGTNNLADQVGHGTRTASVIAANTNNRQGVAGVCWNCKLAIAKACDLTTLKDKNGKRFTASACPESALAKSLAWAVANKFKVINYSQASLEYGKEEHQQIINAYKKGSIVVTGAGNFGDQGNPYTYPAKNPETISVASTSTSNVLYGWSEYGNWIDLAAPGCTTMAGPRGRYPVSSHEPYFVDINAGATREGNEAGTCGTSFSAPLVSGVIGLMLSQKADITTKNIKDNLSKITDPLPQAAGRHYSKNGLINALKAVQLYR